MAKPKKQTKGILSEEQKKLQLERAAQRMKDPYAQGGSKYSGYYKGFYWINGQVHKNVSDDEIPELQSALSSQQLVYQNRAQRARNQEQNILKRQLNQQNRYYERQLELAERQTQASEQYANMYQAQLDEQARMNEATQARAEAESNRATTLAYEERSNAVMKRNSMQTRAAQRVESRLAARTRRPMARGLLSSG